MEIHVYRWPIFISFPLDRTDVDYLRDLKYLPTPTGWVIVLLHLYWYISVESYLSYRYQSLLRQRYLSFYPLNSDDKIILAYAESMTLVSCLNHYLNYIYVNTLLPN